MKSTNQKNITNEAENGKKLSKKEQKKKQKQQAKEDKESSWIGTLAYILVALAIGLFIRTYVMQIVVVSGESMVPTLQNKQVLVENKMAGKNRFKRNDIVIFTPPEKVDKPNEEFIKRVIGVPGDTVKVANDILYVNDVAIAESYLTESKMNLVDGETLTQDFTLKEVAGVDVIPAGKYFVMGDNRRNSNDSRAFGLINAADISGEASFRIWPFKAAGSLAE